MADKFLDKEGLQIVADNTNLRVKIVTEVPSTPRNDMVILYNGADTTDFKKGSIYKYNGTEWESLGSSAEQVYDATSEKAQSGKAVEQAVEEFITNNTSLVWEDKIWGGYGDFQGNGVWTDGINIYLSEGTTQHVLDKSTDTWEEKTWNNMPDFGFYPARDIWTDGENIYLSQNDWDGDSQKVLNRETSTWEEKTWYGLTRFKAQQIWKDGDNIYYSSGANQYVLNKATDTWESKTWNGLTSFDGEYIWTDGTNIYYSSDSSQYVLNKSTDTWEEKIWYDSPNDFYADMIWTDGNTVYFSGWNDDNYILDRATSTWKPISWGDATIHGSDVWKDGDSMYCNVQTGQSDWVSYVFHRKFNTLIK